VFVVVEGIEGTGKSTLIFGLAERLKREGHDVAVTREPGGTPLGDAAREIFLNRGFPISPLAECMLVNAARAQHVLDVIRPALAVGRIVLCDRFTDSTLAYQGYGRGLDVESLREVCDIAAGGLEPDLVVVLDLPVSVARARLRERNVSTDRIEREDDAFHERVRQGFLLLAREPKHRVLDATLPVKVLVEEALSSVLNSLQAKVT
jgi:dTMP kinase